MEGERAWKKRRDGRESPINDLSCFMISSLYPTLSTHKDTSHLLDGKAYPRMSLCIAFVEDAGGAVFFSAFSTTEVSLAARNGRRFVLPERTTPPRLDMSILSCAWEGYRGMRRKGKVRGKGPKVSRGTFEISREKNFSFSSFLSLSFTIPLSSACGTNAHINLGIYLMCNVAHEAAPVGEFVDQQRSQQKASEAPLFRPYVRHEFRPYGIIPV